jgi:hypothetical protein
VCFPIALCRAAFAVFALTRLCVIFFPLYLLRSAALSAMVRHPRTANIPMQAPSEAASPLSLGDAGGGTYVGWVVKL